MKAPAAARNPTSRSKPQVFAPLARRHIDSIRPPFIATGHYRPDETHEALDREYDAIVGLRW